MKTIALAGNPNSGKSTLFNALTGGTAFVGNWPGVTVEKKEGKTTINGETVRVMDLPGIYSLSPYSNEEIISRDFIIDEKPDVIIDIVDASNLERNLFLTTQLIELGAQVIVALNMIDVVKNKGEILSAETLSKELGCPVCEISAINNQGLPELKNVVNDVLTGKTTCSQYSFAYTSDVQAKIEEIVASVKDSKDFDNSVSKNYFGLQLLQKDANFLEKVTVNEEAKAVAEKAREELETKYDDEIESIIAEQRYTWIKSIINTVIVKRRTEKLSLSDKIDKVLTNKWLGFPIFLAIIFAIYYVCLNPSGLGKKLVGITFGWVFQIIGIVRVFLEGQGVWVWLTSLVCDGILFGVGIVVAFIPYLAILFVFLAILEECGYMARVTFIFDRLFRRFGLSGKSFIPMLLGTGCTVQAVAATRTIEDENDRKMTIFLTPFIPCATMMPTITLVVSVLAGDNPFIAPLVYIISIGFVVLGGIFLKHTFLKGKPAPFVMELPEYKIPRIKNVVHFVLEKIVSLFKKLTTIIVVTTVIVWFLQHCSFTAGFGMIDIETSLLADIGRFFEPIFKPLGFGNWKIIASMITGYVAKDNMLATLGTILGANLAEAPEMISSLLPGASAVSFLCFFILSCPCFASIGAMRKELGTSKLTWQAIAFQMGSAYVVALVAYQILRFIM